MLMIHLCGPCYITALVGDNEVSGPYVIVLLLTGMCFHTARVHVNAVVCRISILK